MEKTSNNGGGAGKRVKMRGPRGEMARSLSLGCDVVDLLRILGFWASVFGLPRHGSGEKDIHIFSCPVD